MLKGIIEKAEFCFPNAVLFYVFRMKTETSWDIHSYRQMVTHLLSQCEATYPDACCGSYGIGGLALVGVCLADLVTKTAGVHHTLSTSPCPFRSKNQNEQPVLCEYTTGEWDLVNGCLLSVALSSKLHGSTVIASDLPYKARTFLPFYVHKTSECLLLFSTNSLTVSR